VVSHLLEEGPIEDGAEIAIWFYIGFVPADEETYETCSKYSFGVSFVSSIFLRSFFAIAVMCNFGLDCFMVAVSPFLFSPSAPQTLGIVFPRAG
jgi:hypothetical protein